MMGTKCNVQPPPNETEEKDVPMRPQHGITLVESLVAVAIVGVMSALAIPAFHGVIEQNRAAVVAERMHIEIVQARNAAVFRRRQVVMCRTVDFRSCHYSGVWSDGTMTFEDRNYDQDLSPGEPVLSVQQASDFEGLHMVGSARRPVIGFRPDGRSAGSNQTLRLCAKSLDAMRLLIVNVGGRTRVSKATPKTPRCGTD